MNTHRTVAWLAIFMIITPFLAIPDWLMQAAITILGLAVISSVWLGQSEDTLPSEDRRLNASNAADNGNDEQSQDGPDGDVKERKKPQDDQHQNIEDPEADTMVAADRWRRRASRDIS